MRITKTAIFFESGRIVFDNKPVPEVDPLDTLIQGRRAQGHIDTVTRSVTDATA